MISENRITYALLMLALIFIMLVVWMQNCFERNATALLTYLNESNARYDELVSEIDALKQEISDLEIYISELESKLEQEPEELSYSLTDEEIDMIAQITMAEAGNQCELGQRLVIDTVLNRVDHENFPDTIYDVIHQKNQFSPISDGNYARCYPREDLVELVKEELLERTNTDVIFFRTTRYSDYGEPLFKVGDHYFSKYA